MSVLNSIQVADSGERSLGYDPVRVRRRKLAAALQDQLRLLEAELGGETYRKVRVRRERDLETDKLFDVEQQRRVAPWWWVDDDGIAKFALRYGSAKLQIKDGKDVIMVPSLKHLAKLLPELRKEVLAGALDEALAQAAVQLQSRFKARKKASS